MKAKDKSQTKANTGHNNGVFSTFTVGKKEIDSFNIGPSRDIFSMNDIEIHLLDMSLLTRHLNFLSHHHVLCTHSHFNLSLSAHYFSA